MKDIVVHSWGDILRHLIMDGNKTIESLGLLRSAPPMCRYTVVNKQVFMLAVIEYGIDWSKHDYWTIYINKEQKRRRLKDRPKGTREARN